MLYEDQVVDAVANHLRNDGWTIESVALAVQAGDDIVASREGVRLLVEAKGEGSSKAHTAKFGKPFDRGQVGTHVAVAVLRSLRVSSAGIDTAALAFPAEANHQREISRVWPALSREGIEVFWVTEDGEVKMQSKLVAESEKHSESTPTAPR
jgi:hypothetical protein